MSREACLVLDDRQRIVDGWGSVSDVVNLPPEDAIGLPCYQVVRGKDPLGRPVCGPDCPSVRALRAGRLTASCALRASMSNGRNCWLVCTLTALPRPSGGALLTLVERDARSSAWESSGPSLIPAQQPSGRLVRDLASLAVLSTSLPAGDLHRTVDYSLDWLREATGMEVAELFVADPHGREMFLSAFRGPFKAAFSQIVRFHAGVGFPGLVLTQGTPITTRELPSEERYLRSQVKERGFRAYVCVPVVGPRGVMGTLNVASRRVDVDMERALGLASWASHPIGLALQNALLWARNGESAQGIEYSLTENPERAFDQLLRSQLRRVMDLGGATAGALFLLSDDGKTVARRVVQGPANDVLCSSTVSVASDVCPALRSNEPASLSGGRSGWPASCRPAHLQGHEVCCLPLTVGSRRLGIVVLHCPRAAASLPSGSLALLMAGADQASEIIAQAWTNLQFYEHAVALLDFRTQGPTGALEIGGRSPSDQAGVLNGSGREHRGPYLQVRCLGPFEVHRDDQLLTAKDFPRRDAFNLLKILLVHRGRIVPYEGLVEMLQPESGPQAVTRLHVLVHALRRVLEPSKTPPWLFIRNDGRGYFFNRDAPYRLDLEEFQEALVMGRRLEREGQRSRAIDAYEIAASIYRGDLFEDDPYAEWCWEDRETLREQYLDVLSRLAELSLDVNLPEKSAALYRRALKLDPLRERSHLGLIRSLWLAQQPAEALRCYQACREVLERELGIGPGPEVEQLMRDIQASART